MNPAVECAIVVTLKYGKHFKFKQLNGVFYYFDTENNKFMDSPADLPIQS